MKIGRIIQVGNKQKQEKIKVETTVGRAEEKRNEWKQAESLFQKQKEKVEVER